MVMRFLDICQTMDMPCIKVRKNSRVKWKKRKYSKKPVSLGTEK